LGDGRGFGTFRIAHMQHVAVGAPFTRIALRIALFTLTLLTPLAAQAGPGPYLGLEGGLNWARDQDITDMDETVGTMTYDDGWIGGVTAGMAFPGGVRPELEFAYRRNQVDRMMGTAMPAKGHQTAKSGMFNLWYDFRAPGFAPKLRPFIGGGAGAVMLTLDDFTNARHTNRTDSDPVFGYQWGAGLNYEMSERWTSSLGYRKIKTRTASYDMDMVNVPYAADAALLGVRYSFGNKETYAQAAAAEPAPQPAEQAEIAAFETVVLRPVNFKFDHADLTRPAQQTLDDVASQLAAHPELRVTIEGHTDWIGTEDYNLGLGQRRAESVRDYLVQHGVDASQLEVKSLGESQPVADNHTRAGRAMNRRAEFEAIQPPKDLRVILENPTEDSTGAAKGPEDPVPDKR
jgi:outer membrane protein OmpA-like peptidoglycan-associated protein